MSNESISLATLRLDKWLWFARLARSRSLAAQLCAEGRVSVGHRDAAKPHLPVKIGDVVVIEFPHQRRRLIVRGLAARRGPPALARLLYDEPAPPAARDPAPEWVSLFTDDDLAFEA